MRKRVKGVKLSRKKGARLALAKNLAKALILTGKIKTTKTRAKFAQKYVDRLVALAKEDSLATKRMVFARLSNKKLAKKLITEIVPKFANLTSGFTRIINLGTRTGDAAPVALLEFAYTQEVKIEETEETSKEKREETKEIKNETSKKRK